jgi:hypothetical protein
VISPHLYDEKGQKFEGIYVQDFLGYTKCLSNSKTDRILKKDQKNIHHLGACMIFRSSFRLDERFPHGMEDIEFSKRLRNAASTNSKIVSNVLVLHKGQESLSSYSYNNEKKSLQGKFILFEPYNYRLLLTSLFHVISRGPNKKERLKAIKDAVKWNRKRI